MLRSAAAAIVMVLAASSIVAAQTTVTARWDANTDPYTAGYRVYYGTASGSYQWSLDAGNQTSAPINLSPGSVYYFAVRAYNASYQLGPASNEATINLTQPPPPAPPTAQISASLSGANTALVSWQTTNATSATINGAAVGLSGSTSVTVTATTTFTLVASAASGQTATASATVTLTSPAPPPPPPPGPSAPGAPTSMASSVSGSRATLSWRAPTSGGAPSHYLLYVGTSSGWTNVTNGYVVGNVLTVNGDLPRGRYYARVRAANAVGVSPESNQVSFRVGRWLRTPGGFNVTWQGTAATLSWTPSVADVPEDVPSGYVIEAGTQPGLSDVATINVGNVTSFQTVVPPGIFYVRVRAINALGDSDPTADLVVRPPGAPNKPHSLSASGSGSTVDLRWIAGAGGPSPTGYVIEAGSAPGLSDLAILPVGNVTRFVTTAPPGNYYVRVRAVNASGPSEASNEILVQR